ncbi:hypothetical protein DSM107003_02130 [Trichormus variabilis SAG 1403-4b]|uniref:DUF4089 domain-containing protein n=2 Tax=Anabaena variabilis TaxID=264691 RepID=A0A433V0J2_ANAVA|nr:hypothetical protein DSM107003_02130 [Trichormus variabilis SAG 1403-4b]
MHIIDILVGNAHPTKMENQNFNVQEYVKQMSILLNLEIKDEYQDGVIANFDKIKDIAEIVNNFTLPESIEIAPTFEP